MKKTRHRTTHSWGMRVASGLLATAMSLSFFPVPTSFGTEALDPQLHEVEAITLDTTVEEDLDPTGDLPQLEEAGHWADPYTEKMVEYGYMRSVDANEPDHEMSRAEFMAVINRAYNYTDLSGEMVFEDVLPSDWFYEDVDIATTAGFISGTSPTTVEPFSPLSRETTAFILGKNLMLPTVFGEDLNFTDTRDISSWSRALVKATSEYGLMAGYADGSFRPLSNITRGEISALVMKAIGTPILESGETSLGEVFGNVTITESGTILKNTVIAGDLHISNGIGLGSVLLENVTVLGRIVISGGESEAGDPSILLRNVVSEELVIDNMADQKVSVRVDGTSYIANTYVRTNAYVEDTTSTDNGLRNIEMDADAGIALDLAGRIKNVTNTSPGTLIRVVDGTVDVMTIDETATEVVTEVLRGAEIIDLNIDVATNVTGDGDIKNATVNADDVVIEILPDNIIIRPGITANVGGEDMDNLTAEEASAEPKILSGYPQAKDVSPTSLRAVFATNKTGVVHWAVSNISMGSVMQEDLIEPPTYGHIALHYGSIDMTVAEEEFSAMITELPIGGNYYLSAVFVDVRGDISPVKVISFTTPDDTVPAFAEGYPYMSDIGNTYAQASVMATKDCKLFYAVLPKGAVAPTADDFLSGSVSGSLGGVGILDLQKNKSEAPMVSQELFELTEYDLYLWLTDADGMNYSEVTVLSFTTIDGTPPEFIQEVSTTNIGITDVSFNFSINEDGTLYYAVVPSGTYYPSVKPGDTTGNLSEPLNTEYAGLSVKYGIGAQFSGTVAAKGHATTPFTLSGLEEETAYDMYYVAVDGYDNISSPVIKITFNTVDNTPPVFVEQLFSHVASESSETPQPYATTSISLVFSEGIQATNSGQSFMQLYTNVLETSGDDEVAAKKTLGDTLEYCFPLYTWNGGNDTPVEVRNLENEDTIGTDWIIDYRNATVTMSDGKMYINFPTVLDDVNKTSALNLSAGTTYGFKVLNIRDSSSDANIMVPPNLVLDQFTTVYAEISLWPANLTVSQYPFARDENGSPTSSRANVDQDLLVKPNDMGNVDQTITFEMRMEPDDFVAYDIYMRIVNAKGEYVGTEYYPGFPTMDHFTESGTDLTGRHEKVYENWTPDENGWIYLNMDDMKETKDDSVINTVNGGDGVGLIYEFWGYKNNTEYPFLFELSGDYQYQFVFEVTKYKNSTVRGEWNGIMDMNIKLWAGNFNNVTSIGKLNSSMTSNHESAMSLVSTPGDYDLEFWFSDDLAPEFATGAPQVDAADTSANVNLTLTRPGILNYVVVEAAAPNLVPLGSDGLQVDDDLIPNINSTTFEEQKVPWPNVPWPTLTYPTASILLDTTSAESGYGKVFAGSAEVGTMSATIPLDGLDPLKNYYIYFVTKSTTGGSYSPVYVGKFTTLETEKPKYQTLKAESATGNVSWNPHVDTQLQYLMLTKTTAQESPDLKWVYEPFYTWLMNTNADSPVPKDSTNLAAGYHTFQDLYLLSSGWNDHDQYCFNEDGTQKEGTTPLTVLHFLTTEYQTTNKYNHPDYSSGYTLFDVFATDLMKSGLYDSVNAQQNSIVSQGTALVDAKDTVVAVRSEDSGFDPDSQFVFFVMGYNVNTANPDAVATTYTFRSLANFSVTDLKGPVVENMSGSINGSAIDGGTTPLAYSGMISVSFDKYLYANAGGSTRYLIMNDDQTLPNSEVWNGQVLALSANWNHSYVGIPGQTNITVTNATDPDVPTKTLNIHFKDISSGSYIQIFSGSYFLSNKNGTQYNGNGVGSNLLLEFKTQVKTTVENFNDGSQYTTYETWAWWESNWDVDWTTGSGLTHPTAKMIDSIRVQTKEPDPVVPEDPGTGSSISTLSITGDSSALVGNTATFNVLADGEAVSANDVTWSINNKTLGSDSKNANAYSVKALSAGTVTVTARYEGLTATTTLTIPKPVLTLVNNTATVGANSTGNMTVTISNVGDISGMTGEWSGTKSSGGAITLGLSNSAQALNSAKQSHKNTGTKTGTIYYQASAISKGSVTYTFGGANVTQSYEVVSSGSTNG